MLAFRETDAERRAAVELQKKLGMKSLSDMQRKCFHDCLKRHKIEVPA